MIPLPASFDAINFLVKRTIPHFYRKLPWPKVQIESEKTAQIL